MWPTLCCVIPFWSFRSGLPVPLGVPRASRNGQSFLRPSCEPAIAEYILTIGSKSSVAPCFIPSPPPLRALVCYATQLVALSHDLDASRVVSAPAVAGIALRRHWKFLDVRTPQLLRFFFGAKHILLLILPSARYHLNTDVARSLTVGSTGTSVTWDIVQDYIVFNWKGSLTSGIYTKSG